MKYWVCMKKSVPLREYKQILFSGFIEGNNKTIEEVKQMILEHHKKKKVEGLEVTVIKFEELQKET